MRIRHQFLFYLIIFGLMLIVITASIIVTNTQVAQISVKQDIAGNIQNDASKLYSASNNYFLYQNDSQLLTWKLSFASLANNLIRLNTTLLPEEQAIVKDVQNDLLQLNATFANAIAFLETAPNKQSLRNSPEFQTYWSQLSDKTQTLIIDSATLSQAFRNQSDQLELSNLMLIFALISILGGYFFVNYLLIYRRTLKSISNLQAGIAVIGSGNLDYSIKVDKKDEIGDLTNSFNHMAISLKDMTAKLKDQERMAAIGQTAGMVGHDLRNPLQSIIGEVYLAQEELRQLPDSVQKSSLQESIQMIADQISYMDKIVSDLQTFVKPVEVHKGIIPLKEFISAVLAQTDLRKNIKTRLQMENDFLTANADPLLLKRVLINLVTNAVQAMPNGGNLTVRVQPKNGRKVEIIVEDTGVGIPEEIRPKIFTPLFTTKAKGQGFGLAVCKRVIEAQGGTIDFESQVNKGTKFILNLPA